MCLLTPRPAYEVAFRRVKGGGEVGSVALELPWPRPSGQYFWTYYLEGPPGRVGGAQAWKALVPFRGDLPATVEAPWLRPGRLSVEGFFYPHGVAFVLTASCRSSLTLEEAVDKAFDVRKTKRFEVAWDGEEASDALTLEALACRALDALHEMAFGSDAPAGDRSVTPFSVVTVVRGRGVDPGAPPEEGGPVHRALEALTTWRPSWRYDVLPDLSEASLRIRTAPPSHVLYGRKRGRAVWYPALFTLEGGDIHSLSCYHRNLVLASLQVESLGGLIASTVGRVREGVPLSACHRECARRAAGILGRLYGGVATYRSWSPRAQIEQNGLVPVVNEVRDFFDMPALS